MQEGLVPSPPGRPSPDARSHTRAWGDGRPGILLIQLGTPDSPTPAALRPYLRQFLSDRRVIEVPAWKWWFILNFFILPTRPAQSAAKYQRIWEPVRGSPLLYWTRRQTDLLQARFAPHPSPSPPGGEGIGVRGVPVRFGMQIGNPPLDGVVREMIDAGIDRLVVVPMYPQYSATTLASATDGLFKTLMQVRRVPALRIVPPYYEHPGYIDAMAAIIQENVQNLPWQPEHFILSFHGIPIKYAQSGDPYATHVKRTTFALLDRLGWPRDKWTQTFQSLFGRDRWLRPYTEEKLKELAAAGVKRVFVAMPGFTADCLETLDEIGYEAREAFRHAGGEELYACPCLNDHPKWIDALETLVREEGRGWLSEG